MVPNLSKRLVQPVSARKRVGSKGSDVHLFLHPSLYLECTITLPVSQQKAWRKALPFLIEEMIAGPIEDNHVVPLEKNGESIRAIAIHAQTLQSVLNWARENTMPVATVLPLSTSLAPDSKTDVVVIDGNDSFVSTTSGAVCCDEQSIPALISSDSFQSANPSAIVYARRRGSLQEAICALLEQEGQSVSLQVVGPDPLSLYAVPRRQHNLMRGQFGASERPSKSAVSAVAAAGLALSVSMATLAWSHLESAKERASLQRDINAQAYAELGGQSETYRSGDIGRHVNRLINAKNNSGEERLNATSLLNDVSWAVRGSQPTELRINADRSEATFMVHVRSTSDLENIVDRLQERSYQGTYSATRNDTGYRGDIRVEY